MLAQPRFSSDALLDRERLTKPFDIRSANMRAGKRHERLAHVYSPLMLSAQAAEAVEPAQGPLDDPTPLTQAFSATPRRSAQYELRCLDHATTPDGLSKRTRDRGAAYLDVCKQGLPDP